MEGRTDELTVNDALRVVDCRVKCVTDLYGLFLHQGDELLEVSERKGTCCR